jgi:hypothetical protein
MGPHLMGFLGWLWLDIWACSRPTNRGENWACPYDSSNERSHLLITSFTFDVSSAQFLFLHPFIYWKLHSNKLHERFICNCIKEIKIKWKRSLGLLAWSSTTGFIPSFSSLRIKAKQLVKSTWASNQINHKKRKKTRATDLSQGLWSFLHITLNFGVCPLDICHSCLCHLTLYEIKKTLLLEEQIYFGRGMAGGS